MRVRITGPATLAVAAALSAAPACGLQVIEETDGGATGVPDAVQARFTMWCATPGCHSGGTAPNLSAGSSDAIIGMASTAGLPIVEIGNVPGSQMAVRLLEIDGAPPMPPASSPQPPGADVAVIIGWIAGVPYDDTDGGMQADDGSVSFAEDVAPLLAKGQCTLCHHENSVIGIDFVDPFTEPDGLVGSLNTWAIDHPEGMTPELNVDPGNPEGSFLLQKIGDPAAIDGPTAGGPMPMVVAPLTTEEIQSLRMWIDTGAADDDFFAQNVRPIFGNDMSLGQAGKCSFCHHSFPGGTPPNLMDPFNPATGIVNVMGSAAPVMRVAPGDSNGSLLIQKVEGAAGVGQPMPPQPEQLTEEEVALFEAWILDGAQDN